MFFSQEDLEQTERVMGEVQNLREILRQRRLKQIEEMKNSKEGKTHQQEIASTRRSSVDFQANFFYTM